MNPDPQKWKEPLAPDERVQHLLNRITFGPRRGDRESVSRAGPESFLEEQLYPEKIDDAAVEAKLGALPTLTMSPAELIENFPAPKPAGKLEVPRASQKSRAESPAPTAAAPAGSMEMAAPQGHEARREEPLVQALEGPRRVLMELAQEEVLRAVYSSRQLEEVMVQFWMNHFNIFAPKGADKWLITSYERDTIRPHALGKFGDLLAATAQSPAMLFYLDNWMSAAPNADHAGGPQRFRKGLGPNRLGDGMGWGRRGIFGGLGSMRVETRREEMARAPRPGKAAPGNHPRGINENYGRELMELHTLGVDGGYTQKDVVEVARCFTGWTIERPRQEAEFIFNPRLHDFGSKVVLDHKIRAGGGMEDGLKVLSLLAHHPSTAHHILLKLCRRFVADDPPGTLVDRASRTFLKSGGDLRAVLKTVLTSPEFNSQAAYQAKTKSPLELAASALRGLGASTDAGLPVLMFIARMGEPMFQYQAPTGFPDRADTWINSGSLLVRVKFAEALAANRLPGTEVRYGQLLSDAGKVSRENLLDDLTGQFLGGELSEATRQAILKQMEGGGSAALSADAAPREIAMATGLLLASPEFQRK